MTSTPPTPGSDPRLSVTLDDEAMTATLRIPPNQDPAGLTPEAVEAELKAQKIPVNPKRQRDIREAISRYKADPKAELRAVIAQGTPPTHGLDGALKLEPAFSCLDPASDQCHTFVESQGHRESMEAIDPHTRSSLLIVRAGQKIGRLSQPTRGQDGTNLLGESVPAKVGKPFELPGDETVGINADGVVTARVGGLLTRNGARLRVLSVLELPGDVDFSCGNIDFPGEIRVAHGVRDGFIVKATLDVHIGRLVEAATLHAGRDVHLKGGMAGRHHGSLHAGRDLHAAYLEAVHTWIGRDAHIQKEISNCKLTIGRRLIAPRGGLVGGELMIAGACELGVVGSEAGVATHLVLGRIPEIENLARGVAHAWPLMEQNAKKAKEKLEQLERSVARLTARQAEELTELQFHHAEATAKLKPMIQGVDNLVRTAAAHAHPQLVVHNILHQGVKIWIGQYSLEPKEDLKGPLKLDLSKSGTPQITRSGHDKPEPAWEYCRGIPDDTYIDLLALQRDVHKHLAA